MKTPVIPPDGPRDAKCVVLGEAPGREEVLQRKPFVGPSGQMLFDDILLEGPVHRTEVLVLNTCWVRPRGNDLSTVSQERRAKWAARTWEILYEHPRDLVIAVGGTALRFMFGQEAASRLTALVGQRAADSPGAGIYKLRGSPLRGRRTPADPWLTFIPMIHPAALLHEQGARYRDIQLCRLDTKKARRWLDGHGTHPTYQILNYARLKPADAFTAYRKALLSIRHETCVAFDLETSHGTISTLGLASSPSQAIVLPLTGEFSLTQTSSLLELAKGILEDPTILKVAQNVEFDTEWLRGYGIGVRGLWMDTLLAHGVIHPETPHSLACLTSIYTDQSYYKDMPKGEGWNKYTEVLWDYCGMDCCMTWACSVALTQELAKS